MNRDDIDLPPRPSSKPLPPQKQKPAISGIPFIIYINGKPVEMSRGEALGVMSQIISIMLYLDTGETGTEKAEMGKTGKEK